MSLNWAEITKGGNLIDLCVGCSKDFDTEFMKNVSNITTRDEDGNVRATNEAAVPVLDRQAFRTWLDDQTWATSAVAGQVMEAIIHHSPHRVIG